MDSIGTAIVVLLVLALVLLATPFIFMVVCGAFASQSHVFNYAPGFWESVFGLWTLGIAGGVFNGTKNLKVSKND